MKHKKSVLKILSANSECFSGLPALHLTNRFTYMKGNKSMMTTLNDIPFDMLLSCEWIIITHKYKRYYFENDRCFLPSKELKLIKCGGSIGYKINGKFRSLTWIKQNRKPHIEVWCNKIQLIPF